MNRVILQHLQIKNLEFPVTPWGYDVDLYTWYILNPNRKEKEWTKFYMGKLVCFWGMQLKYHLCLEFYVSMPVLVLFKHQSFICVRKQVFTKFIHWLPWPLDQILWLCKNNNDFRYKECYACWRFYFLFHYLIQHTTITL